MPRTLHHKPDSILTVDKARRRHPLLTHYSTHFANTLCMQGHTVSRLGCFVRGLLTLSLRLLPGLFGGHLTHCLSTLQSKLHNGSLLPPCTKLHNSPLVHFTPICRSPQCTTRLKHLHAWPACSDFTLHTCPTGLMP